MSTSRADARFHQDSIKKMWLKDNSLMSLRECEGKAAPLAKAGALCPDLTAHRLCQRLGNRQTNARAAKSARTRFVDAVEAFEDVRELIGGEADTCIDDAEGNHLFLRAYNHLHATRRGRVA